MSLIYPAVACLKDNAFLNYFDPQRCIRCIAVHSVFGSLNLPLTLSHKG